MSPTALAEDSDYVQIYLRVQSHPTFNPAPLSISRACSIGALKQTLHDEWPGQPRVQGITCVLGGRVCRDGEVIGELFPEPKDDEPFVLFVIVKPDSWTLPLSGDSFSTSKSSVRGATSKATSAVTTTPDTEAKANSSPEAEASLSSVEPEVTTSDPVSSRPEPNYGYSETFATDGLAKTSAVSSHAAQPSSSAPAYLAPSHPGYTPSYVPALPPLPSLAPSASLSSMTYAASPFSTFLAHLSRLESVQRNILLLSLQKAHAFYVRDVDARSWRFENADLQARSHDADEEMSNAFELNECVQLLQDESLWSLVVNVEEQARREWQHDGDSALRWDTGDEEYPVVQINGLPYLLYVPPSSKSSHMPTMMLARYVSLKRGRAILSLLTTMLHLLMNHHSSSPVLAYSRSEPLTSSLAHAFGQPQLDLLGRGLAVRADLPAERIPRRRGLTISIVLNLEALVSILFPLLVLSAKLAFLLWIFGRHASPTKRWILAGMGAFWILWEGWTMYSRRVAVARARAAGLVGAAVEGRRRRAGPVDGRPVGIPADPRPDGQEALRRRANVQAADRLPAAADAGAGGGGQVRHRRTHRHRRSSSSQYSRFSPKYWITRIALIGLVDEALELGLAPRSIAGRPVPYPSSPPGNGANAPSNDLQNIPDMRRGQTAARLHSVRRFVDRRALRKSALRTALIGVVLFFGTLIPEVERKRRKALEKRERLLNERRSEIERQRALLVVEGERERVRSDTLQAQSDSDYRTRLSPVATEEVVGESSVSNPATSSHGTASDRSTATPSDESHNTERRQRIPDDELFADGLSEPDQRQQAPIGHDGEGSTQEDDLLTDDDVDPDADADANGDGDGDGADEIVALF